MFGHQLTEKTKGGRKKCARCGLNLLPAAASGRLLYTTWYVGPKLIGTDLMCPERKSDR